MKMTWLILVIFELMLSFSANCNAGNGGVDGHAGARDCHLGCVMKYGASPKQCMSWPGIPSLKERKMICYQFRAQCFAACAGRA